MLQVPLSVVEEVKSESATVKSPESDFRIPPETQRGTLSTLEDVIPMLRCNSDKSHAYNKGKILVVSKVPLPNYRADLDERHGSTQKEIRMSTETEIRVGNLLDSSHEVVTVDGPSAVSSQGVKPSSSGASITSSESKLEIDTVKEGLSVELKQKQEKMKGSNSVKMMQVFREKLPAFKMKSEFLKAVADNQVQAGMGALLIGKYGMSVRAVMWKDERHVGTAYWEGDLILVVSGETGCGKTTQLPQFILEEEISSLRGADCSGPGSNWCKPFASGRDS
ncbi:DExH-box ATP-dependent RNA helicase DExH1-like [Vitis vinifera]|uniref:DExH-box ATP-dependent RNA helicase DExH1-like n=1 Tax=Vitis vinifera TaxID=29760 RepID=UPI002882DCB4|nr:DExH-box ATP-dependent RNA helicase DExH1-like [Vitis vinifera]